MILPCEREGGELFSLSQFPLHVGYVVDTFTRPHAPLYVVGVERRVCAVLQRT